MTEFDIAIIGAGPAGMAAAQAATARGAQTVIIDSLARVGGQFWRHGANASRDLTPMHAGRAQYRRLHRAFKAAVAQGSLVHLRSCSVWMASAQSSHFELHLAAEDPTARLPTSVRARAVVLATGAYDRQLPIPGWDLPGVMAAGGVQGFIKQHGFAPGARYVIAGTGPFLLPVALNVIQSGARLAGVYEAASLTGWARHLHRAISVPSKMVEGVHYAAGLAARRVPYRTRTVVTKILGQGRVEAVEISKVDATGALVPGTGQVIEGVDGVGLGWGFTPQIELAIHLGAGTELDVDGSLVVGARPGGASTVPGLFVAGEVTGVGGATLAVWEGTRAGGSAAGYALAAGTPPGRERWTERNHRAFAASMHAVHRLPPAWPSWVPNTCQVCRCEEVTAGQVRAARTQLGASDQRSNKGLTRAGMGWCQGRMCGFAVATLAQAASPSVESLRSVAHRPIVRPVALQTIADLGRKQT